MPDFRLRPGQPTQRRDDEKGGQRRHAAATSHAAARPPRPAQAGEAAPAQRATKGSFSTKAALAAGPSQPRGPPPRRRNGYTSSKSRMTGRLTAMTFDMSASPHRATAAQYGHRPPPSAEARPSQYLT